VKKMVVENRKGLDLDRFRLRNFVAALMKLGEVEVHEESVALGNVSRIVESTPKAVLFKRVGPEAVELVANVMGSRRRLAAALGVGEHDAVETYLRRLNAPLTTIDVSSDKAPVHQVILRGKQVDLTKLPFHLQHEFDGSPYISSAIDFTLDPDTGRSNVGARRLSLRNRTECGTNLTGPSDVKGMYMRCIERRERLPIAFAIGCHPTISLAAELSNNKVDEIGVISALREAPVPLVKCITNDIRVPADVEMILEGYLDERGYCEPDGPYGEYMGYYGEMHNDPVFHCTAITMRRDALHQTVLHGSTAVFSHSDTGQTSALQTEAIILELLRSNGISEPVAVHAVMDTTVSQHIRVAIRQRRPGDARAVISAIFGAVWRVKHLWVFDHDIDVRSDAQCEWAFSTRFQGDRDLVMLESAWGWPGDPSLQGKRLGTKLGFDCTVPFGPPQKVTDKAPRAPVLERQPPRFQSVRAALEGGPKYLIELMSLLGSSDGRELMLSIDDLRNEGVLGRNKEGQYLLCPSEKGVTAAVD
jgi:2,5-furandicarboxylate decarboxylase 1